MGYSSGITTEELLPEYQSPETNSDKIGLIIHGASGTKIGFGGEKYPRVVYPEQHSDLTMRIRRFPLEGSKPTNEDLLKAYWDTSIKQLNINLTRNALLLSLPTAKLTNCPFREFMEDYFFNHLGAQKLYFVSDPFLFLVGFASQTKTLTALVIDIGFSQIRIVPFYRGTLLEEHVVQIAFGSFDLTLQLGIWLKDQAYEGPIDAMFIRDIMENYCFVRPHNQALTESQERTITYHINKYNFELSEQRWKLPELFFHKKFFTEKTLHCPRSDFEGNRFDLSGLSLPLVISYVIKSFNSSLWETLCSNICLTGGGAKFVGLKERIQAELKALFPEMKDKINIITSLEPSLMSFKGASKLSTLPSFQKYWISMEDYLKGEYELFI